MKAKKRTRPVTEAQASAAWAIVARYAVEQERKQAIEEDREHDDETIRTILAEEFTKRQWEDFFAAVEDLLEGRA